MKNLIFGIVLAPYRIDYYNYMSRELSAKILMRQKSFHGQLYATDSVENQAEFEVQLYDIRKIHFANVPLHLRGLVSKFSPAIVVAPEFSLITVGLILLKYVLRYRYKIVVQCDDSYDMFVKGRGFTFCHQIARRLFMPLVNDVILVDQRAVDWCQAKYKKGIWMPIIRDEVKFLQKINPEQRSASERLELLFVARLISIKNLSVLLDACTMLRVPYHLTVVGDGPMREAWENEAKEKQVNATFVGAKQDNQLYSYYCTSHIFILFFSLGCGITENRLGVYSHALSLISLDRLTQNSKGIFAKGYEVLLYRSQ